VADWLNGETRKAFAVADVRERFLAQGMTLPLGTPQEFSAFIAEESKRWGDIVRKTGMRWIGDAVVQVDQGSRSR
jgi:tripartite-type tricarboxylate transporter receptor subunit TctC